MIQKATFSDGGFVLHKVFLDTSNCKFSVWFDADGNFRDAERIDRLNRSLNATPQQKRDLARLGRIWK